MKLINHDKEACKMTALEEKRDYDVAVMMDVITRLHAMHAQIEQDLLPVLNTFEANTHDELAAFSNEAARLAHRLITIKADRQKQGRRF